MKIIIKSNEERDSFLEAVSQIDCTGKSYSAEFKVYRKQRTLPQNKLYRLWISTIANETGNEPDALHEYFKQEFLPWVCVDFFGEEKKIYLSTTKLDTKQFTEFLNRIQSKMYDFGIQLPIPGDLYWEQYLAEHSEE